MPTLVGVSARSYDFPDSDQNSQCEENFCAVNAIGFEVISMGRTVAYNLSLFS